jgi:hypothetical protein
MWKSRVQCLEIGGMGVRRLMSEGGSGRAALPFQSAPFQDDRYTCRCPWLACGSGPGFGGGEFGEG